MSVMMFLQNKKKRNIFRKYCSNNIFFEMVLVKVPDMFHRFFVDNEIKFGACLCTKKGPIKDQKTDIYKRMN